MIYISFSFVWVLSNVVVAIICWDERHRDVLHGTHFPSFSHILFVLQKFLVGSEWIILFKDVFLQKDKTGVALNTFPNVLLIFNICQCLLVYSLIFGNNAQKMEFSNKDFSGKWDQVRSFVRIWSHLLKKP